ncbi:uncharacterized protein LOC129921700 isoform X2 [Biomphalaria glabrata]|uniref:Uncharacterized protein LOC129921700 isoform X2 n=1 Tax=Biomphalaria glabrata TaxID=6526 RepID=A0A9W2YC40_BIOGL|nr:uncharacterized protein LOC129921700 isoform X2 [Biomphalaria glabrata]
MPSVTDRVTPFCILLTVIACALGNHNKWWTCNSECARCVRRVTPMEELIVQFYPGLFSQTPPENMFYSSESTGPGVSMVNSGTAEIPSLGDGSGGNRTLGTLGGLREMETNRSHVAYHPSTSGCCETVTEYLTPPNVTIKGQVYRVVHLRHAFQFIPIGKCRKGSTCQEGQCVEQYRAHWVLVYNTTTAVVGPPVSFSPIEVPSHCECMNVGRS